MYYYTALVTSAELIQCNESYVMKFLLLCSSAQALTGCNNKYTDVISSSSLKTSVHYGGFRRIGYMFASNTRTCAPPQRSATHCLSLNLHKYFPSFPSLHPYRLPAFVTLRMLESIANASLAAQPLQEHDNQHLILCEESLTSNITRNWYVPSTVLYIYIST